MRKETKKPQSSYAVAVVRDRSCGDDVQAARISIITDENHLAGVTVSRATPVPVHGQIRGRGGCVMTDNNWRTDTPWPDPWEEKENK